VFFTRAVSGSRFLPMSVFWVAVCVFLLYIPPLYSQSTVLVAASNQVLLVLWVEIHYLCSLRWPTGSAFSPLGDVFVSCVTVIVSFVFS